MREEIKKESQKTQYQNVEERKQNYTIQRTYIFKFIYTKKSD